MNATLLPATRVRHIVGIAIGLLALAMPLAGDARVVSSTSSSYGAMIELDLVRSMLLPGGDRDVTHQLVSSGPLPHAFGTAPPAYEVSASLPSTSLSVDFATTLAAGRFLEVGTGELQAVANGGYGLPGESSADGIGTAHALTLAFFTNMLLLNADLVSSGAGAAGDFGALITGGATLLRGGHIEPIPAFRRNLPRDPAKNTTVDLAGLVGVSLILNEQIVYGDGVSIAGISVNGIHLHFENFVVDPSPEDSLVLNGDVIFGHAQAQLRAEPDIAISEPSMLSLLACALCALAAPLRRRSPVGTAARRDE